MAISPSPPASRTCSSSRLPTAVPFRARPPGPQLPSETAELENAVRLQSPVTGTGLPVPMLFTIRFPIAENSYGGEV
jgi:hypothetical protein